ncbi:hypothetical protein [Litorimonas sp. WD9-15]
MTEFYPTTLLISAKADIQRLSQRAALWTPAFVGRTDLWEL